MRTLAWLSQPLVQLFLAIIAIASLVTSIWFGLLSIPPKPAHLSAAVVFELDVLGLVKAFNLPVHIAWDESIGVEDREIPVSSIYVTYVKLINDGGSPLDWGAAVKSKPSFTLDGKGQIFMAVNTKPTENQDALPASIFHSRDEVTVETSFLNPGDFILLTIAHNGQPGSLRMHARVLGQGEVTLEQHPVVPITSNDGHEEAIVAMSSLLIMTLVLLLGTTLWLRRGAIQETWTRLLCLNPPPGA